MKKVLFPIVLSLLVGGQALAAHPTDTLTILRYRALPVTKLTAPMETDSPLLTDFIAPVDTVIRLEGGRLYRLSTAILSTSYEKASLMVSCTMPYKLYFDGKVLGEKNRVLTDPQEDHYDLTIYPLCTAYSVHCHRGKRLGQVGYVGRPREIRSYHLPQY